MHGPPPCPLAGACDSASRTDWDEAGPVSRIRYAVRGEFDYLPAKGRLQIGYALRRQFHGGSSGLDILGKIVG